MSLFQRKPNPDDVQRLEELCVTIGVALRQFERCGLALEEIRDRQLYRVEASTFEEFCAKRWNMTRRHADRLIEAAAICRTLRPTGQIPNSERQARVLAPLPQELQTEAWQEAVDSTEEGAEVATVSIQKAVDKRRKTKRKLKPIRVRVPGATVVIEPNSRFQDAATVLEFALDKIRARSAA